jgi:hypothetical protein
MAVVEVPSEVHSTFSPAQCRETVPHERVKSLQLVVFVVQCCALIVKTETAVKVHTGQLQRETEETKKGGRKWGRQWEKKARWDRGKEVRKTPQRRNKMKKQKKERNKDETRKRKRDRKGRNDEKSKERMWDRKKIQKSKQMKQHVCTNTFQLFYFLRFNPFSL